MLRESIVVKDVEPEMVWPEYFTFHHWQTFDIRDQ